MGRHGQVLSVSSFLADFLSGANSSSTMRHDKDIKLGVKFFVRTERRYLALYAKVSPLEETSFIFSVYLSEVFGMTIFSKMPTTVANATPPKLN